MANYSDLKLKLLDELCDKLDELGIEGNIIQRDPCGNPYVSIWYGDFKDHAKELSEMFTVVVTDHSYFASIPGSYEIKPPNKYCNCFNNIFKAFESRKNGFYVMKSDQIIHVIKHLFDIETSIRKEELKKENKMSEFTLKTALFGKLNENDINYRFIDGVYNPEKIVITTKMNHDICTVRSISYSEDSTSAYEVRWTPVPTHILIDLKIMSVKRYDTSNQLIKDILRVEKELRELERGLKYTSIPSDVLAYAEADVLATEALYKYRKYGIVDVIFNDPATIIIWADGSKTVVKAENEKFDPEKGLAMAISKKVLGNKHNYYEVFKKYVGRYEKKQAKKTKKEN